MDNHDQPTPLNYMTPAETQRRWSTRKTLIALALTIVSYGTYWFVCQMPDNTTVSVVSGVVVITYSGRHFLIEFLYGVSLVFGVAAILACIMGIIRARARPRQLLLFSLPIAFVMLTVYCDLRELRFMLLGS